MERKLRKCVVCGNAYKFCPRCNEDVDKPLWYFTFCSEQCKNIYDITSSYEDGRITANDAKDKLDKLELSKTDNFGASYKASITKINSVTTIKKVIADEVVETMVETKDEEIVETVEEPIIVETVEEEKVIKKSKRAKKNVDVE